MDLRKRLLFLLIFAGLASLLPLIIDSPRWMNTLNQIIYYMILALSWNLIMGYTGLFSFGHMGMALVGGYGSALLVMKAGVPVGLAMLLGGLAAALASLLLGVICLRLRGFYLCLVTWAFAEMMGTVLRVEYKVTGGTMGLMVPGLFGSGGAEYYYFVGLALLVLFLISLILIVSSRVGVYLQSIRDDEMASEVMGVDTVLWKIFSFSFSGFWAGIAGAYYAHYMGVIAPSMGDLSELGSVMLMVIIGGIGTLVGPVIGSVFVVFLTDFLSGSLAEISVLVFALLMIVTMRFFRGGILAWVRAAYEKFSGSGDKKGGIVAKG